MGVLCQAPDLASASLTEICVSSFLCFLSYHFHGFMSSKLWLGISSVFSFIAIHSLINRSYTDNSEANFSRICPTTVTSKKTNLFHYRGQPPKCHTTLVFPCQHSTANFDQDTLGILQIWSERCLLSAGCCGRKILHRHSCCAHSPQWWMKHRASWDRCHHCQRHFLNEMMRTVLFLMWKSEILHKRTKVKFILT